MSAAVERVLARLGGVEPRNGSWAARCPAHDDREPSLSVSEGSDGRALLRCFAGCDSEKIVAALGLEMKDLYERNGRGKRRKIVVTYDYHDARGNLLFQVVRHSPKGFRQRWPDGNGGWIWNLKGIEPVLYRLPEVLAAARSGETVYVLEGEKDADRLRDAGLTATCNPMGAGKWRESYSEALEGAHAVILPDADEPGRKHAEDEARSLHGKGGGREGAGAARTCRRRRCFGLA